MIAVGNLIGNKRGEISGVSYEAEIMTYISGLVTPLSVPQLTLLDSFIQYYKNGTGVSNFSDDFDFMYILAGETSESSLRNLVKRAHDCTTVNTPTFTPLEGFTGDAILKYLNTHYNPKTQGVNYTLNDCSFGIYLRTNRAFASTKQHGVASATEGMVIFPLRALNAPRVQSNDATTSIVSAVGTLGVTASMRSNATTKHGVRNKTITNFTISSVAIPNGDMYLLCKNLIGTGAGSYDDVQIAFAWAGRYLTQTKLNFLVDGFEAYMDANGKGVI